LRNALHQYRQRKSQQLTNSEKTQTICMEKLSLSPPAVQLQSIIASWPVPSYTAW